MTARWYRTYGNGPLCPEDEGHGATYEVTDALGQSLYWCPLSQHLFAVIEGGTIGPKLTLEERERGATNANRPIRAPAVDGRRSVEG